MSRVDRYLTIVHSAVVQPSVEFGVQISLLTSANLGGIKVEVVEFLVVDTTSVVLRLLKNCLRRIRCLESDGIVYFLRS